MIELVLKRNGKHFSGRYRMSVEESFRSITIDGRTNIIWDDECWSRIISNLQIGMTTDVCRVLFVSDCEMDSDTFPEFYSDSSCVWQFDELSNYLREMSIVPSEWVINGKQLNGRYQKLFPCNSKTRDKVQFVYTNPVIEVPEEQSIKPGSILSKMDPL